MACVSALFFTNEPRPLFVHFHSHKIITGQITSERALTRFKLGSLGRVKDEHADHQTTITTMGQPDAPQNI